MSPAALTEYDWAFRPPVRMDHDWSVLADSREPFRFAEDDPDFDPMTDDRDVDPDPPEPRLPREGE